MPGRFTKDPGIAPTQISSQRMACARIRYMELLIIRHAQSANNALADERLRVVDPPLTELGQSQAELVAAFLANHTDNGSRPCEGEANGGNNGCGHGITRLYTSAMHRALETAQSISQALSLAAQVWVELHEHGGMWLDHGDPVGVVGYPGMTRAAISARFPQVVLPPEVTEDGWYDPALGYESWQQAAVRAAQVASRLRTWAELDERIALVSHGGFSNLLLRSLLGVSSTAEVFFHHANTGITQVRFRTGGQVSLRYLNRISHLPAALVT